MIPYEERLQAAWAHLTSLRLALQDARSAVIRDFPEDNAEYRMAAARLEVANQAQELVWTQLYNLRMEARQRKARMLQQPGQGQKCD